MFKRGTVKLLAPIIAVALLIFPASEVSGQSASNSEGQGKMNDIINRQTETLQKLFAQEEKIKAMEKQEEGIAGDIAALNSQTAALQRLVADEETAYSAKKEDLKQFLQSYQMMGAGSYLEIILKSKDLTDFLQRLNILRNIAGNSGKLIAQIQSSQEKQTADQAKLTQELASLKDKEVLFSQSLANEQQFKKDLENNLASLSVERVNYQKYLTDLQTNWAELKPEFARAIQELSDIIEKDNLPPDAFKLTYNFLSIKVSVTDDTLNKIIAGDPGFPQMLFAFQDSNVEIRMPDENLVLDGIFVIQDGDALKLQVNKGSFDGIPLETGSINDLFADGDLVFNLKPMLGSYTINSLEIKDGYMELGIAPER